MTSRGATVRVAIVFQPASFDVAIKSPGHRAADAAGLAGCQINGLCKTFATCGQDQWKTEI